MKHTPGDIIKDIRNCEKFAPGAACWLTTVSPGIRIHLIFRVQNPNPFKKLISVESIYGLESESISFFTLESESIYPLGEPVMGPGLVSTG